MDTPGITVVRPLTVFGYDEAPYGHAEVSLENVCVPASNLVLGEGDGFKIAQGRLGPGRIHHCMRAIGLSERVLALAVERSMRRKAFGRELARQATVQRDLAQCRMELDQARLLVLHAAWRMDTNGGAKGAQQEIAMIKAVAPNMGQRVVDVAIQLHGGAGVSEDFILARAFAYMRCLRIADGPDEVHVRCVHWGEGDCVHGGSGRRGEFRSARLWFRIVCLPLSALRHRGIYLPI
jgi:acyl-CoA dehydrogenase